MGNSVLSIQEMGNSVLSIQERDISGGDELKSQA